MVPTEVLEYLSIAEQQEAALADNHALYLAGVERAKVADVLTALDARLVALSDPAWAALVDRLTVAIAEDDLDTIAAVHRAADAMRGHHARWVAILAD